MMKMRLIDAEKLEKKLREVIHECIHSDSAISESTILVLYMLLDIIRDIDTAKKDKGDENETD